MAEEAPQPVNYVSDNPEQDWARFDDVMRRLVSAPKADTLKISLTLKNKKRIADKEINSNQ